MEIIALDPGLTINILVVQRTHSKTDLSGPAGLLLSSALSLACRALPNHRLLLRPQRHTCGWLTAGFDTRRPEGGKAEHRATEWQAAMEVLILVAENGGPTMFARIGVRRALNRHVERVFSPGRKDMHWGKRTLKRDQ
jgi:hypothetical protein